MEDQRKTALYKIVLVVGNGFDIDLGLPTRYFDFLGSVYFKRHIFDMKIKDSMFLIMSSMMFCFLLQTYKIIPE